MPVKYALVTGAASGMGRCYALQLAQMGYGVLLVDINNAALQPLSLQITEQYSVPAPAVCIDLCRPDAAEQILTQCRVNHWQVEVLVNNAGMLITSTIEETHPERLRQIVALHCITPMLLCRLFVPLMKEQGGGYILNISSISAWMDWPVIGMYGTTKRFVKAYSRQLNLECYGTGVSVTTAFFGAVDTPLLQGLTLTRFRKLMFALGLMITPEKASSLALKAMFRRKATLVPGFLNRLAILFCPLFPAWFLRYMAHKVKIVA